MLLLILPFDSEKHVSTYSILDTRNIKIDIGINKFILFCLKYIF